VQPHSQIRLAVFDLDGTLVDSRRDLATAANALVMELGGSPLSEEAVGDMVGEGAAVLVTRALAAAGVDPVTPGALPRFLELYGRHLLDTTRLYDGVAEALETVSRRMPLAVLTNKPQEATDRIIDGLVIRRFFGIVIGGDTPLGRKPDPSGLLHIARTNHVQAAETILVGDSPVDLETARRAGAKICIARYGFGYRPAAFARGEALIDAPSQLKDEI
jgi:phosphoglycolate phosphatase